MKRLLKSMDWLLLASGILTGLFGLAMLVLPAQSLTGAAVLLGLVIVASGILELINAMKIPSRQRMNWMLLEGVLTTLIGAWMIFGHGIRVFWNLIPFVFAALIMANGVVRIDAAGTMKRQGMGGWGWLTALGIGEEILGFFLLFSPLLSAKIGTVILALLMLLYGASNVALALGAQHVSGVLRKIARGLVPPLRSREAQ